MKKLISFVVFALAAMMSFTTSAGARPLADGKTMTSAEAEKLYSPANVRNAITKQQKALFHYFWNATDPEVGVTQENLKSINKFTLGGGGFGVMATIVGVERGWVSRKKAAERIATTVEFLDNDYRIHGVWSHWVDRNGKPLGFGNKQKEAGDVVETSFMMMGLLCASEYFNNDTEAEKTIREKTAKFVETIEWDFYTNGENWLYWAWNRPDNNFILPVTGYNETLVTYILALGAPEKHGINSDHYYGGWLGSGEIYHEGRTHYSYPWPLGFEKGGPLFLSHYSFLGMDPRNMQDKYVNYYDNCVYHAMINRHYCLYEAPEEYGYDEYNWGLTACFGPKSKGYKARSPRRDDGVIAPTAAIASMPYTPFYSIQVLMNLLKNRPELNTKNGFVDAYSQIDNWNAKFMISIDQGPMIIMMENYRSGLFWNLMADNEILKKGFKVAGIGPASFKPGFFYVYENSVSGCADLIRHPDREKYELPFWSDQQSEVTFVIKDAENGSQKNYTAQAAAGKNLFSFDLKGLAVDRPYEVAMLQGVREISTVKVILH